MSSSSSSSSSSSVIQLGLPKGRMQGNILKLLSDAGIEVTVSDRGYRPLISLSNVDVKLLKPQNIIEMLVSGSRDLGFGGADWVQELIAEDRAENIVELMDTGLDPVRIVAAAPSASFVDDAKKSEKPLRIASEYEQLTKRWIEKNSLNGKFVKTYGATECFPPEDADAIVDNTATGSTLKANGLHIVDTLLTSSTRLYASAKAYSDPIKKARIDEFVLLLKSVLAARERVMVTFNIEASLLAAITKDLPCMRAPTISPLHLSAAAAVEALTKGGHGNDSPPNGFAVSVCVPKSQTAALLPTLKAKGATDVIVSAIGQIIA